MDGVPDTCPGGSMRESHIRVRLTGPCLGGTFRASGVRLSVSGMVMVSFRVTVTISFSATVRFGSGPLTPESRTGESRVSAVEELGLLLAGLAFACDC